MVFILASNGAFSSPVRGKTAILRDATKVTGDVVAARPGRFPDGAFWFLDETIRDAAGAEHRCRLLSDSVRAVGSRGRPSPKPFILRFESDERARAAADTIGRVARAYAEGRIEVRALAERAGETTFRVAAEGGADPKVFASEFEAVEAAEDLAAANPEARVAVTEVAGVIPTTPFGRFVEFDEVKAWVKANLRVGMLLVLEETHGGIIRYMPARVAALPDRQGRFSVELPRDSYAASYGDPRFYVSGKLYQAPTGQSRLLPPFREAVDAAVRGGTFYAGKHLPASAEDARTADIRGELSRQPVVPWSFRRPAPPGSAALAAALERATEHPVRRTIRKLAQRGVEARPVMAGTAERDGEAPDADTPDADAAPEVAIQVVSLAQLRGGPKQVQWARSVLAAFRKARGLDRTGAVPTRDDEVALGCAIASLIVDHRELLRAGDAAGFAAAVGARWVEFDGIDAYRATPRQSTASKESAKAWHWHTVTVGGLEYGFEAVGHERWIHKGDRGRFAWIERNGRRRVLEGTLWTEDKTGGAFARGNRASKPQGAA